MENPRSDIALGAVSGVIGLALLLPTYRESENVFLLPGDISPFFAPKIFVFAWIGLSLAIMLKGLVTLRKWSGEMEHRNWGAIIGTFVVALLATGLMKPLGYLVVAPVAVFVSVWLIGYRNNLVNLVVAVTVSALLYLMLSQIAGLTLPRAFWQG
ncbi:MAG: tripartite tricarboxylate transporter TctB family protein [Pseudomonadota bacterium]